MIHFHAKTKWEQFEPYLIQDSDFFSLFNISHGDLSLSNSHFKTKLMLIFDEYCIDLEDKQIELKKYLKSIFKV